MQIDARCNFITSEIIGAAIEIHRALGPGLLESPYASCLKYELCQRPLRFASEVTVPLTYKGKELGASYRVDLIVENLVVVEVKAVETVLSPTRTHLGTACFSVQSLFPCCSCGPFLP